MCNTEKQYALLKSIELCCRDVIINITIHDELGVIQSRTEQTKDDALFNSFWAQTRNNALFVALLRWCQVFGTNKESTHWKNIEDICHKSVRTSICNSCAITESEWKNYHEIAVNFRNQIVAHVDTGEVLLNPSRYIDIYLNSAITLRSLIVLLMTELDIEEPSLRNTVQLISKLTNKDLVSQARGMARNRFT